MTKHKYLDKINFPSDLKTLTLEELKIVADDLLDYKGSSKDVGKKTQKDVKSGKATLINLIGYDKSIKFAYNLKNKIISKLKKYGKKSKNLIQSLEIIISRSS